MAPRVTVVVPTIGRPSLRALLAALAAGTVLPEEVVLVDDRRLPTGPLLAPWGLDPVGRQAHPSG